MDISGFHAGAVAPVIEAFERGFTSGREVGAALSVIHAGETLVDVWAGHTDRARQQAWQRDTLVCCFSVSKAISALCTLQLVDRGQLELDQPVAKYWPEFAAAGKEAITVRQVFAHQAGLPGLRDPAPNDIYYDWHAMCAALAATRPWWTPGTAHGYHARTLGFLLGEMVRRVSGDSLNTWLQREITGPLGGEFYFELDARLQALCATLLPARVKLGTDRQIPEAMQRMQADFNDPTTPTGAAFQNPAMKPGYMNTPEFRAALIPAVNGHATARGLTHLLANVGVLLSPQLLDEARATQSRGPDQVLKSDTHFGLGLMLWEEASPIGRPGCFGHAGAGGSIAFYDPAKDIAFAFVMNQMQEGVVTGGTTATECVDALYEVL